MGTPLAEAYVRVRALTDRFKPDVEKGFAGLGDQFGRQFSQEASARLRDERGRFAAAGGDLGAAAGDAGGEQFGRRMAERGAVQFGNDGAPFVATGRKLGDDAGQAAGEAFGSRFTKDANGRWHDERGRFVAAAEQTGEESGDGFNRGFDRKMAGARGRGQKHGKDVGDGFTQGLGGALSQLGDLGQRALGLIIPSLSGLASGFSSAASAAGSLLATVGKWGVLAAGVSAVGAAAASAAGYTVELAAAIAPLSGLLAGLPGIALVGAAAFTTWKLATGGLGEAMSAALAGNAKALEAALGKLSEGGRQFVTEFEAAIPALKAFKAAAQDAFTEQLAGHLRPFIDGISGLKPAITDLAAAFGGMVRNVLEFASASGTVVQFDQVLRHTRELVGAIWVSLDPLLQGFVDLGEVGARWLGRFSGSLQSVLTTFGEWMSEIARSGTALAWLQDATKVLQQLGRLVKDVWGVFTGLLDAAATAGGSALGVLGQLVHGMNEWINSAKGQTVLVEIFRALADIGRATLPVIEALAGAVGLIAPQIAAIATVAMPVLTQAINALVPAIAAIGPGIVALVEGIGSAVTVIGPALLPVGQAISAAFSQLKPLIAELGPAIAALLPGVSAFLGAFSSGLAAVKPLLEPLGGELGKLLGALGGALGAIIPQIAKIALSLAPALTAAITALGPGLAAIGPGLAKGLDAIGRAFEAIGPLLEPLGGEIGNILAELGGALALIIPQVAKIALALAPALASALHALGPALAALGPGLVSIAENLGKAFASEAVQNGLLALGKALSDLVIAAAPLIPHLTQIAGILLQVLGGAVTNLAVALGPVIEALGNALAPALDSISRALEQLIPYMEPLYKAFGDIGAALITELLPPILDLIPTMIDSMIPAFVALAEQLKPLIPLLSDFAIAFLKEVLPALLPMLPELSKMSIEFTRMGLVLAQLVADVAPYIERMIQIFQYLYDRLVGHSIIPDLINGMTKWFRDGVQWITDIVSWFGLLPGMIANWLGQVLEWVQNKWNLIKNTIAYKIDEIKAKIGDTLDSIKQKWNDIWNGLKDFVSDKWEQIKSAVSGKVDDLLGTIRGIPGRITGALGNLGALLYDSGRSILQGLIDGLYSKLQDAYNSAADILNRIRALFPFSPAKEGPFSGKGWTSFSGASMMTGLAAGILREQGAVTGALDSVLRAGAATLGAGLQVPLAAMAGPTTGPAFPGAFGAVGASPVAAAGPRIFNVENIILQGVFDPSNPVSYRRTVEQLREAIRELEKEEYANV